MSFHMTIPYSPAYDGDDWLCLVIYCNEHHIEALSWLCIYEPI